MTGQSLLDLMELVFRELQLQTNEADVTRGLLALNVAQDYFETLAAQRKRLGGQTGTVSTTASGETTTLPTDVIRIDTLDFLDASTSIPKHPVTLLSEDAGHRRPATPWPYSTVSGGEGEPRNYWLDGDNFFWRPIPEAVHTIRWYGFQRKSDLTAAGTFAYDDGVALPTATFAARLMKLGLDDPIEDLTQLAEETFGPILHTLQKLRRERGATRQYAYTHDT